MENGKIFAVCMISSLVLVVLMAGAIFVRGERVSNAPEIKESSEEFCKTIQFNGNDGINLVFFSDAKTARSYYDEFFSLSPFRENKDRFNTFYIDSYNVLCDLYQDIATFCYSPELVKEAALCGADYIIVIDQDKGSDIRSSAYNKVASINAKHPKREIIAHELGGHLIGGFAEEYIPARLPFGQKNCLSQNDFGELGPGHIGCSAGNYYRFENEGVMRTLKRGALYGEYNEKLLEDRILKKIGNSLTGRAVSEFSEGIYYAIEIYRDEQGLLHEVSKKIETGFVGNDPNGFGGSSYVIYDENDEEIYSGNLNEEYVFTEAQEEDEEHIDGEVFSYEGNFVLFVLFDERAEKVEITNSQGTFEVNVANMGANACEV